MLRWQVEFTKSRYAGACKIFGVTVKERYLREAYEVGTLQRRKLNATPQMSAFRQPPLRIYSVLTFRALYS